MANLDLINRFNGFINLSPRYSPQEDYNSQISQPQQPAQPFRFQTDWYIPQMAQEGTTIQEWNTKINFNSPFVNNDFSGPPQPEGEVIYDEELSNLPEITITGKAPEWFQYRREFEENNPKGSYIYDNRSMWTNKQILSDKYEREANQYVYDQLIKNNPRRSGESRGEYIQRITGDSKTAQDIIEQNKNRHSSTSENVYTNFARGYLGLSFNPFSKAAKTAIETKAYAPHEREQITNSPLENIGNMADILSVPYNATVGAMYTRSQGQDNYNMASGLSGQVPENRDTMLEISGDPLNIVGVGAVSKANASRKAIQQFGKYSTKNTPLRNTYKLNPNAVKSWGNMGESPHWLKGYIEGWNPENIEDVKKLDSFLQSSFDKGRSNQSPIGKLYIKRANNKITREEFIKKADKIYGVKDSPIESYANPRGSGTHGEVYKIRNSDEVIKRMIKGDDYIQDFDKLVEKGNRLQSELGDRVSFVKKSIVGESEVFKGKKDVTTIMRDLKPKGESINMLSALKGKGNIKDSAWKTLKEDIKKLNDNGLYVDLNNYDNIVYDVDKGKFIIFDINDTRNILSGEGGNFKGGLTKELSEKLNNLLPKQEAYTLGNNGMFDMSNPNIYKSADNSTGPVIDFGYKPKLSLSEKAKYMFMNSREKQDFLGKKAVDDAFDFADRFMKDPEYLKRFKDIKSMTPSTAADEKDVINYIREGVRSGKIKSQNYSKEKILNMSDDDIAYNFADAYRYNTSNVSFQDKDKLPAYLNRTSPVPQQTSVQHLKDGINIDAGTSSKKGKYSAGKIQSSKSESEETVHVGSKHLGDLFNVTIHEVLGHGKTYGNVTFTQKEKELLWSVFKDNNNVSSYIKEPTEIMARIDEIRSVLNRDSPFRVITKQDLEKFEKMVNSSTKIPGADSNKGSTMLQFIKNADKSKLASVMNKMYSGTAAIGAGAAAIGAGASTKGGASQISREVQ